MKRRSRLAALACVCLLTLSAGVARAIIHQFAESFTATTYKDAVNTTADWNTAAGELKLFPFVPSLTGTYNTPGLVYDVAVAGDLAFVADGGSGLQIINITNPAIPTLTGAYNTTGNAGGVAIAGDLAFVADGASGLQIINITNPAIPTLTGTYNTTGNARDVVIAGDLAFVADEASGLQIVNITNPAIPALVGTYNTPGFALDVAVAGDLVFVADEASGLQIINITNPAIPTLTGTYNTPGEAYGVAVDGDLAFVADFSGGLQIIDITTPASPTLTGTYNTPGIARRVAVAGDLAFVADDVFGLQVIRVGHPVTIPTLVGTNFAAGSSRDVAVTGDLAFVTNEDDGLQIIDIVNPASPTLTGSYDTPGVAFGVAVAGDLAFVGDGTFGLQIINIVNPASPVLAGTYNTPGNVHGVAVAGDLAFVADGASGLQIINIVNPAIPTLTGTYNTLGTALDVAVAGDLVFVADADAGLQIINIVNPASPTLVGTYDDTSANSYGVAVAGDLAFLVSDLLKIINITNPASPTLTGTYDTYGQSVAVAGELALVANFSAGLIVIQVFQHEVDESRNIGRSLSVDGSTDTIHRARLSTTQTAGVSWQVSANAGTNWQAIAPDNAWNAFAIPGSDLRWRSTHTWAGGNPTVSDLHLAWLNDHASIDAVTDIPNDQGRQVSVEWTRSGHDFVGDATQIVEYAVYRKIDPDLSVAAMPATASTFEHLSPSARENALMMLAAGWHFLVTVPVLTEDSYAVVVPTLKDSTIVAGPYQTIFRITALTATPGVFFHSPPDSGYSLDNLAPSVPANFAITFNPGGGSALAWDESPNADFQYFRVYRSSNPNFTPSPGTLVHSTTTNGWVDPDNDPGVVYFKVTATDFSGNESGPASAGTITGVDGAAVPRTFALYPNVPNPFNPTTLIRYDVPESGGDVSLRIYDVSGRVVKTLVEGRQNAGAKSLTWDGSGDAGVPVASGVYFYRLTAPGYTKTHKMVLMK